MLLASLSVSVAAHSSKPGTVFFRFSQRACLYALECWGIQWVQGLEWCGACCGGGGIYKGIDLIALWEGFRMKWNWLFRGVCVGWCLEEERTGEMEKNRGSETKQESREMG